MPALSFWLVALGAPLVVVAGSAIIRLLSSLPRSVPADILLALVVFDFAVVVQGDDFAKYVNNDEIRSSLIAIYAFLLMTGLISWAAAVLVLEKKMVAFEHARLFATCDLSACTKKRQYALHRFPFKTYLASLSMPSIQLFGNILPFVLRH